jgi:four helix bundle protein
MQNFRNLTVWKKAHSLMLDVYRMCRDLPKDEQYNLVSQIRRACVSIEANIAEGCGRGSDADFARFLQMAMGSATELECHLLISFDLGLMPKPIHQQLEIRTLEVKKMLSSLLNTVRSGKSMFS